MKVNSYMISLVNSWNWIQHWINDAEFYSEINTEFSYKMILASCSNAGFSAGDSLIVQIWHCTVNCRLLTASPIPPTPSSKHSHIHHLYSLWVFSRHHLRKVLEPFLHLALQELLECLLLQLVQLIQTLVKVCTGEAICGDISGRLIGRQSEQGLEVGNKRLGYLLTLIQCRARQRGWYGRKLGASVIAICTNWHVLQHNTRQYAYDVLACIVACIVVCIGGMYWIHTSMYSILTGMYSIHTCLYWYVLCWYYVRIEL